MAHRTPHLPLVALALICGCDPAGWLPTLTDKGSEDTTDTTSGSTETTEADADVDADSDADTDTDTDTEQTPPADTGLPPGCGDLTCSAGEDCATCPVDCGACRASCDPDGVCSAADGETCVACPADCDTTAAVCGNGECDPGEHTVNCMADCGPVPWPTAWADLEERVLTAINAERAAGTDCPSGPKGPAGPLQMDTALQAAARLHSWDQSYSDYFAHDSCNGRSPWDREGSASAENIAWNYRTPEDAVDGWMTSTTGHCDAIMQGSFTRIGIGHADVNGEPLWTAMFR